jgi:hypothetical protein
METTTNRCGANSLESLIGLSPEAVESGAGEALAPLPAALQIPWDAMNVLAEPSSRSGRTVDDWREPDHTIGGGPRFVNLDRALTS